MRVLPSSMIAAMVCKTALLTQNFGDCSFVSFFKQACNHFVKLNLWNCVLDSSQTGTIVEDYEHILHINQLAQIAVASHTPSKVFVLQQP